MCPGRAVGGTWELGPHPTPPLDQMEHLELGTKEVWEGWRLQFVRAYATLSPRPSLTTLPPIALCFLFLHSTYHLPT